MSSRRPDRVSLGCAPAGCSSSLSRRGGLVWPKTKGAAVGTPRLRSSLLHRGLFRQAAQGFGPSCRVDFSTINLTHAICVCAQVLDGVGEGFALKFEDMSGNRLLEIQGLSLNLYWVKFDTRDRVSVIGANAPVVISHSLLLWLMADFSVCESSLTSAFGCIFLRAAVVPVRVANRFRRPDHIHTAPTCPGGIQFSKERVSVCIVFLHLVDNYGEKIDSSLCKPFVKSATKYLLISRVFPRCLGLALSSDISFCGGGEAWL